MTELTESQRRALLLLCAGNPGAEQAKDLARPLLALVRKGLVKFELTPAGTSAALRQLQGSAA